MNVRLRTARASDATEMARWFPTLTSLAEWGGPEVRFPLTEDQLASWIAEGGNEKPRICFTATGENDLPTGHVQFLRDPERQWARLGRFGIAPALRGRGYGKALFDKAVRLAFSELGVEYLQLAVVQTNERARRLYLHFGFRDEGPMSGSWTIEGQPYLVDMMGLRRGEWLHTTAAEPAKT